MLAGVPANGRRSLAGRLRPLLGLLGPHRGLLAAAIVCGAANQLLTLAAAGTAAWLVGQAITGASAAQLGRGLIVVGAVVVPMAVTAWLDSLLAHIAAFRVLADLRGEVYLAFERLAPAYLLEHRSGDLGAAAMSDIEQLEIFFAHTLSPLVVAATVPLAVVAALASFHWALALALLPVLALLATVPAWLRRQAEAQGVALRARLGEVNAEVVDTFQGLRELVSFGGQSRQIKRVEKRSASLLSAKRAHGRRAGIEHAATDALATMGLLAVLTTAAVLVRHGSLAGSFYPVAVVLAATTFAPVIKVTDVARELNQVAAAAERVQVILRAPTTVTDQVATPPPGPIGARVCFEGVTFRYRPDLPDAVHDATFTVGPGETVALVGHSGAGKSTCAHLLLRLWDVTDGAVTVGGHDVRAFPQESLRQLVTVVPQDVYLFNISLGDNIRLGCPDADDHAVRAAARAAQADEFIAATPDGYDTLAGEFGSRLSGGQRQRIALARALLKDAPILVMDEAVSNLDVQSEREVAAAMAAASAGRTTLVVAHRMSTIRTADRIVVLELGRVVESGTHHELMARGGAYARLLESQVGHPGVV